MDNQNIEEARETKIVQAQDILKQLGLPPAQQNPRSALTLLALCNIKPFDNWSEATRYSLTLATQILTFIRDHYGVDYKYGTRETFRKDTLKQLVEFGLADKNPDDPDLPTNSPHTHYAVSPLALNVIQKFQTPEWDVASESFKLNQSSSSTVSVALVKSIYINNFKSLINETIELGRFNVFIGVNGCGKTNILEALATIGAERSDDLTFEGLYNRGVRIARPNLVLSSFKRGSDANTIDINLVVEHNQASEEYRCSLAPQNINDIYTRWINVAEEEVLPEMVLQVLTQITKDSPGISGNDLMDKANEILAHKSIKQKGKFDGLLSEFAIYDVITKSLRGIAPSDSKKTPLGINGEGLDLLIASFNTHERKLLSSCHTFFDWLEEVIADKEDNLKLSGLRAGRSISTLYFRDRYMNGHNSTLSAENSNEGILHVLFYLALFISAKTPRFFAIDNIETALNPRLCQVLTTELVKLSKETKKQVLVTTHNPAILDGLNLLDDEQRLFEVYRDTQGHTRTRRKKFKADLSDKKFKLSEMWLKGLLGAVPENF
jgi:energy-coupling factor transporter ATP-binding protein EcfA2